MTPAKRKALEAAGYKIYDDPEEMLTDVMGPMPSKGASMTTNETWSAANAMSRELELQHEAKQRQEIIRRRNAIDASELDEHGKFARAILRIKTCRDYLQAECGHPKTENCFGYRKCEDCGKFIKENTECSPPKS